jgi:hypothetical protein
LLIADLHLGYFRPAGFLDLLSTKKAHLDSTMEADYSLYLVTDSTDAILKGRHLPTIVKEAIEGGSPTNAAT